MKLLVLGANGMIGSAMMHIFSGHHDWQVFGLVRNLNSINDSPIYSKCRIISGLDLNNADHLSQLFCISTPDVVINCAGLTKHLPAGNQPIPTLAINAMLPHRLAKLCFLNNSRLVHISTDCVFSGDAGMYMECDDSDARDIYGKTKYLGEVSGDNVITLRTSTIGHELNTKNGLLEWFLAQTQCNGYTKAIFSGLPTVEFAKVIRDKVIPNKNMSGLYHVGANPIDKFTLLTLVAKEYRRNIKIIPDDSLCIDRSLNTDKFLALTGYHSPGWDQLISSMHASQY
jgi:dTDP-4-dehydrorhamnose reductase